MGKLTAKAVENAEIKGHEYKVGDGDGLYLRVRPNGKSWLFRFRLRPARTIICMTLGTTSDLSLKDARAQLPGLRKLVAEGIDPRNARAAAKAENAQAITMQTLFEKWIEFVYLGDAMSPLWAKRHKERWELHLKKLLGNLLVRDVTRAHLAMALDAMMRKGIKEETRKALTTLNLMLDHGLTRHYIEQNPARVLKPKDFSATASRPRDRALTLQELRKLWLVLDQASQKQHGIAETATMEIVTITAIKILILTGARRGEVAGMRWSELDLNAGIWSLESSRTKNRRAHTIYLSTLSIELLQTLQALQVKTDYSKFVFNTTRGKRDQHIHKDTLTAAINRLRELEPLSSMPLFGIHDLRRSAATAWGEYLKTAPHVIERMLNHQPLSKLVAIYQRAQYVSEQKEAWFAWGRLIEWQISNEPENVVPLRLVNAL